MIRYHDPASDRLIYVRAKADAAYWEGHWEEKGAGRTSRLRPAHRFYTETTRRFLPPGARVLDGGCGAADKVHALRLAGFDAHGVDFAGETVRRALAEQPDLPLTVADVRSLPYESGSFDGYWSIGVIEHFWDGFEPIAREMRRVIRPGGCLFLTFPAMSPLRRRRARAGRYPLWRQGDAEPEGFYQFALSPGRVAATMQEQGFALVIRQGHGALRGLREERPRLHALLKALSRGRGRRAEATRAWLERRLEEWAGHSALLVMTRA